MGAGFMLVQRKAIIGILILVSVDMAVNIELQAT